MGKASRDKGARGEREVVRLFRDAGFEADRTGEYKENDVVVHIGNDVQVVEVKVRAAGASAGLLYEALSLGAWAVAHKADRKDWLITLRFSDFLKLIKRKV